MNERLSANLSPAALVSDSQWHGLKAVCPRETAGARARDTFTALLWVLRTGGAWKSLPLSATERHRVQQSWLQWMKSGTWLELWSAYVGRLDDAARLDWCRELTAAGERIAQAGWDALEHDRRSIWWTVSTQFLVMESGSAAGAAGDELLD